VPDGARLGRGEIITQMRLVERRKEITDQDHWKQLARAAVVVARMRCGVTIAPVEGAAKGRVLHVCVHPLCKSGRDGIKL
jgi:hypothetical protein